MKKNYHGKTRLSLVLLTAVLFALGMMTGCGSSNTSSAPEESGDDSTRGVSSTPDHYTVSDSVDSSSGEGIGTLTAYASDGTEVWTAQTEPYPMTELSKTYDIGEQDNGYYVEAGGTVYCFDKESGSLLWKNAGFEGATSAADFDEGGNLYLCGYYGPMLCVITPDGEMTNRLKEPLFRSSAYDPAEFYWPTKLRANDKYVEIYFDSNGQTLYVVPETGQSEFDTTLLVYE